MELHARPKRIELKSKKYHLVLKLDLLRPEKKIYRTRALSLQMKLHY